MSRESVQAFFEVNAPDIKPVVLTDSTATVAEAAQALGVQEGQIAKTLALKVGGVCPFGLPQPVRVFCDISLRAFNVVWPAAGDRNSSVRLTPERMADLVGADWVDVSQN